MTIALELGKDIEEVLEMGPDRFALWMAYFKLKAEYEKKAAKKGGKK